MEFGEIQERYLMVSEMDMKGLLAAVGDSCRFLDAYALLRRKITKSQVFILAYHQVLNCQVFEKQMMYFRKNYEIISLGQLVRIINNGSDFPEAAVVITFDDGYKNNYQYAYPILKKYRIPATIFLTTGHIENGNLFWWDKVRYIIMNTNKLKFYHETFGNLALQSEREKSYAANKIIEKLKKVPEGQKNILIEELYSISRVEIPANLGDEIILSWDEIKKMRYGGISFGAHTVNHPILTNLTLEEAESEIIQSKKDIEKMIGYRVTEFAYPNGDFNADIAELVKKNGFECAVAVSPNKLICPKDDVYMLNRIGINTYNKFCASKSKIKYSGLWGDITQFPHLCTK